MTTQILDRFNSGEIDAQRWEVVQLPMEGGGIWRYEDPGSRVQAEHGVLKLEIERFRLQHDQIPMFDNPKLLYMMRERIRLPRDGAVTISCDMACKSHHGNPDDLLDGFAAFNVVDQATGMVFDFIVSETRTGVVYERLPLPGIISAGGDWVHVIQSPLVTQNTPESCHHYSIRLDRSAHTCEWSVDGKRFYATTGIPVDIESVTPGLGLFTLKKPMPGVGSVSNHGQGATAWWRNLSVTLE